jgi:uncharacterized protein YutE (UPF0331/DUF86 family)
MTPTGVRAKIVAERVGAIQNMLAGIRSLRLESAEAFTAERHTVAAAESYLRRALEALMDLGRHVLAKGFGIAAAEYRDIPTRLHEVGVLDARLADLMGQMARYRNRLVHFYDEVGAGELYEICATRLGDIEEVVRAITGWMDAHPERVDRSL